MSRMTIAQAFLAGITEEMRRDERVFVMGEEVGEWGVYGLTQTLERDFGPARVRRTPISEAGFVGAAVGAAMRGMRPVVELMYIDFIGVCMDQIINQAAKMRYMTGGQAYVPMVLFAPTGCGRRNAGQHSQSLESLLTHIPGLKVIAPVTPADAKGMYKTAIRDDDPVVVLMGKQTYNLEGEVPDEEYCIPFGSASLRREGKDVTIIAWSRQVEYALTAAEKLAAGGVSAEVIDLRSLVPLDFDTIAASVRKTGRVVIAEECVKRGGYGSEIAAQIAEELFLCLKAPVRRVGALNIVPPYSPPLEDAFFPHPADIEAAAMEIIVKREA